MKRWIPLLAVLGVSCGSSTTAPSTFTPVFAPPATPPAPTLATITGHVSATNGGQALGGLAATLTGHSATTDSAGTFAIQTSPVSAATLLLSGSGIVPRSLNLAALTTHDVAIGAIALNGSFDLNFYRQLVRNNYDAPGSLEPLRRWRQTPQIYLKTVDEVGEFIHGPTLDLIEATLKDAVPRWTGGLLGVPIVTRGTDSREGVTGWITVKFPATNTALAGYCGRAQVAVDGGWIELGYHVPDTPAGSCRTTGAVIAPHVVRHEIGHALGFWHSGSKGDLMYPSSWYSVTGLPTPRELAHAAIAYARPVGNQDPDSDPIGTVTLAAKVVR